MSVLLMLLHCLSYSFPLSSSSSSSSCFFSSIVDCSRTDIDSELFKREDGSDLGHLLVHATDQVGIEFTSLL